MNKQYKLSELAEIFGVAFAGNGDCEIVRVADIRSAGTGSITFLSDSRYKPLLASTQASAVIVYKNDADASPQPVLISDNPYALYAKIAAFLHPDEDMKTCAGIHPSAIVAKSAEIDPTAIIGPLAVLGEAVRVGARSYIGSGTVLKKGVIIGDDCKLVANITVCNGCRLGSRVIIHPASVIGSDGFGFAHEAGSWIKIPQLGVVVIEDDVEIGAGVTIDRGALKDTIIENGVKLDNQVHIAHNVRIGAHTAMAAKSGVAGSTVIGKHCAIGGSVGIVGHLRIADGTRLNAMSAVTQSIEQPGNYASGTPLEPVSQWRRNWTRFKQLNEMAKRIKQLERKLEALEKNNDLDG